jgi:hypothetical protein
MYKINRAGLLFIRKALSKHCKGFSKMPMDRKSFLVKTYARKAEDSLNVNMCSVGNIEIINWDKFKCSIVMDVPILF